MRNDIAETIKGVDEAAEQGRLAYIYAMDTKNEDGSYTLFAKGQIERRKKELAEAKSHAYDTILHVLRAVFTVDPEDLNTLAYLAYDFGISGDSEAGDLSRAIDLLDALKRLSFLFTEWDDNEIGKNIVSLRDELEEIEHEL
jgi:hypothetical protein